MLTYNGEQTWTPAHPVDAEMTAAFHVHQATDKGFGLATGPAAPRALARAFRAAGHRVEEGASPWVLGASDQRLVADLAEGYAAAGRETGQVAGGRIEDWRRVVRTGARVGHTDTFAEPAQLAEPA